MPLALSLRKGEDFYVDDARFTLESVDSAAKATVMRESDGKSFDIFTTRAVPVTRDYLVRLSLGDIVQPPSQARVVITAPRKMVIARGDNYRKAQAQAK